MFNRKKVAKKVQGVGMDLYSHGGAKKTPVSQLGYGLIKTARKIRGKR